MKSTSMFTLFNSAPIFSRRVAASCLAVASLAGCSTMKDLSPFGSNVPYAQDIKPTIAQPAVTEVPAFKPAPPAPKPIAAPPAAAPAPAAPAPAAPASDAPPPAPPGPQSSLSAQSNAALASAAPAPASPRRRFHTCGLHARCLGPGRQPGHTNSLRGARSAGSVIPRRGTPTHRHRFRTNSGASTTMAHIPTSPRSPARPVNMPTFLEASTIEKSLLADRDAAKDKRPESPQSPSPDSAPDQTGKSQAAVAAPTSAPAAVVARSEDAAPLPVVAARRGSTGCDAAFRSGIGCVEFRRSGDPCRRHPGCARRHRDDPRLWSRRCGFRRLSSHALRSCRGSRRSGGASAGGVRHSGSAHRGRGRLRRCVPRRSLCSALRRILNRAVSSGRNSGAWHGRRRRGAPASAEPGFADETSWQDD